MTETPAPVNASDEMVEALIETARTRGAYVLGSINFADLRAALNAALAISPDRADIERLRAENEKLRAELAELRDENEQARMERDFDD